MIMQSSSFESPKPYLFGYYIKNSITALLRYVILLAQSTPILLHTEGLVSFVSLSTVNDFPPQERHCNVIRVPVRNLKAPVLKM